jgi:alpha-tubulin suppressor-like RCC1 family protein
MSRWRFVAASACLVAVSAGLGADGAIATSTVHSEPSHEVAWSTVTGGYVHTCGIHFNHSLWCWGNNRSSQLGIGNHHSPKLTAVRVGASNRWVSVQAGYEHTCGIQRDHTLWCWGMNFSGQLGQGDQQLRNVPTQVGSDADWATVGLGAYDTCGIRLDHSLWCWGDNQHGQLGLGDAGEGTDRLIPTRVGADTDWARVEASYWHTCAVRLDHTGWCWGFNPFGELGLGDTIDRFVPTQVGADGNWAFIRTGEGLDTCGTRLDRTLWCWGGNYSGQLGLGDTEERLVPTEVGTDGWSHVLAGGDFTCGIQRDDSLWCWGVNDNGQLGLGDTADRLVPNQVGSKNDWAGVQTGIFHTCAERHDHSLWCWGDNAQGQLGLGDQIDRLTPVRVGG